jgi:hypothetical protein
MVASQFLKTRVSPETKRSVQAVASAQLLTESVWLKRLVIAALQHASDSSPTQSKSSKRADGDAAGGRGARLYIRLRSEDRLLLQARATARSMRGATYIAVLVRAHLRTLAPVPKDELTALKRSVAELGVIGRNLNQLARAANQGGRVGPMRDDLRAFLKVCGAMRDNVKGLIKANVNSWEAGHADTKT